MQRNWLITLRDHFFGRPSRLWRAQYIVTKILLRIKSKQRCRDQDFIDLLIANSDNGRDVSDPRDMREETNTRKSNGILTISKPIS